MIDARRSGIKPRWPAEPSGPLRQAAAEVGSIRQREKIQHRPVRRAFSGRGRRNRLAPDEGLGQPHAFVGKEEKGAVALQRASQSDGEIA